MTTTKEQLDELVELSHEQRRDGVATIATAGSAPRSLLSGVPRSGILAAAGLGTAMAVLMASPAFADKTIDVQMVQTAASLENLAVATYDVALTLDFIGGASANAVVKAFVTKTRDQHKDHAQAFNAAATRLGGKAQTAPDPVLLTVVNNAKPTLTGPGPVVDLAKELEQTARVDLRRQRRRVHRQERPLGDRQHHGRRGPAPRDPHRGRCARRRRRTRAHRAATRRRQAAGRGRQRRVPRRVLQDRQGPPRC